MTPLSILMETPELWALRQRIIQEAIERNPNALAANAEDDEEIKCQKIGPKHLWQNPANVARLGRMTDAKIAQILGCAAQSVSRARSHRGIPRFKIRKKP